MLILTKAGSVYYSDLDYVEIEKNKTRYTEVQLEKDEKVILVTSDKILHMMHNQDVYLEEGYTFHDFILMLENYPNLKLLNVYIQGHLDRLKSIDLNYIENEHVGGHLGILKLFYPRDTEREFGRFDTQNTQVRWFFDRDEERHEGVMINTWKTYKEMLLTNSLNYDWIELHGYGMIGEIHWDKFINNEIFLMPNLYHDDTATVMADYPSISFYEFISTLLDAVCCMDVDDVDGFIQSILGTEDDELEDSNDVVDLLEK